MGEHDFFLLNFRWPYPRLHWIWLCHRVTLHAPSVLSQVKLIYLNLLKAKFFVKVTFICETIKYCIKSYR